MILRDQAEPWRFCLRLANDAQSGPVGPRLLLGGRSSLDRIPISQPHVHGLAVQELNGRHLQIARAGPWFQAREGIYMRVLLDAGESCSCHIEGPTDGWEVISGITSIIGPVLLERAKTTDRAGGRPSIGVGRLFLRVRCRGSQSRPHRPHQKIPSTGTTRPLLLATQSTREIGSSARPATSEKNEVVSPEM